MICAFQLNSSANSGILLIYTQYPDQRRREDLKTYGDIDSKFRYVILASMRAKQLLRGAKARIKSKSRNPIRVAQEEVKQGVVDYEIVKSENGEFRETDEEMFIGEKIKEEEVEEKEAVEEKEPEEKAKEEVKKDKKKVSAPKKQVAKEAIKKPKKAKKK